MAYLRKTNRKCLDFASGYVSLSVPAPQTTNKFKDPKKLPDHVALMPADKFVACFESSREMASILTSKCKELISEWRALNDSPEMASQRTPLDKAFELFGHSFKGMWNKPERSVYELQLNLYGYTAQNLAVERPEKLTMKDIKVCVLDI